MPLINGMKMACEPCIRGHRSTKCTHANERLMVPVKKPGRPLSVCPHVQGQGCGCSSITAAIPRKQKCHCGTVAETSPGAQRPLTSLTPDQPSPTKVAFRVQKSSSRPGSRKQSYDLTNFDRIDAGSVNIIPFHATKPPQTIAHTIHNGNGSNTTIPNTPYANGLPSAMLSHMFLDLQQMQQKLPLLPNHAPEGYTDVAAHNSPYLRRESAEENFLVGVDLPQFRESKSFSGDENVMTEPMFKRKGSCGGHCSSNGLPLLSSHDSEPPSPATSMADIYTDGQHHPFHNTFQMSRPLYANYMAETMVFTYPPSYGSYQHPLQPSEWRRNSNLYGQPALQHRVLDSPTIFSAIPDNLGTVHTCGCGDTCQCVGCLAHPYNDATQNYVRSAWQMTQQVTPTAVGFTNGQGNNGIFLVADPAAHANGSGASHSNEDSSPPANTPSDTSTVEEQTFPTADYIFVSYPFSNESCGGDTNSCPCGDDCNCLGCAIHRPILSPEQVANEQPDL